MPKRKNKSIPEPGSSEDEWEEVEEKNVSIHHEKKDVEIEFDLPDVVLKQQSKKKDKTREWLMIMIKRAFNKSKRELRVNMHKTHLLCLLSIGLQTNKICNDDELKGLCLSLLPTKYIKVYAYNLTKEKISSVFNWVGETFWSKNNVLLKNKGLCDLHKKTDSIAKIVQGTVNAEYKIDIIMIHLLVLRSLGLQARLVMSLQPLPLKIPSEKQELEKANQFQEILQKVREGVSESKFKTKLLSSETQVIPQLDGANDEVKISPRRTRSTQVLKSSGNRMPSKQKNKNNATAQKKKSSLKQCKKLNCESETNVDSKSGVSAPVLKLNKLRKSTISKYTFSSDDDVCVKSGENYSPATKLSKRAKAAKNKSSNYVQGENDTLAPALKDEPLGMKNSLKSKRIKKKQKSEDTAEDVNSNTELETIKATGHSVRHVRKRKAEKEKSRTSDEESVYSDASGDEDFEVKSVKKKSVKLSNRLPLPKGKSIKTKSPGRNKACKPDQFINQWIEVYLRDVGWLCIDCISGTIDQPKQMEALVSGPLHYVVGFDNEHCVKDVTARYASSWLTTTRKLRIGNVDKDWWRNTLKLFKTKDQVQDQEENEQLETALLSRPLPTSIGAFKSHPLYALRRHLLKYEGIYPPDIPPIGYIRGEEILPRSSVHVLHTREKWLQLALSVKDGEEPYKMVASYLMNKKLNRDSDALSLPLFGKWQTENYKPPVAKNGKVPRNDYGNVDLYKPCMLPIGCVHMRLPSLNLTARKLNIDVATAIVGFDTHHGFPHPVTDGYIACAEHEEILRIAWTEEQAHVAKRAQEKLEQKVYSRWKVLIKGMLALERVRRKYNNTKVEAENEAGGSVAGGGESWQAKRLHEAKKQDQPKKVRRGRKKTKNEEILVGMEI
ncbi:DNA repair protein complementing XP-C cells homolog [Clavelina lepadiformis]|uniref:DNA repair protein complementing XP-C cells homolog n=1 Tax=Clavelina lepadiformis TaxID=159417 RepID=UPI00404316C0